MNDAAEEGMIQIRELEAGHFERIRPLLDAYLQEIGEAHPRGHPQGQDFVLCRSRTRHTGRDVFAQHGLFDVCWRQRDGHV